MSGGIRGDEDGLGGSVSEALRQGRGHSDELAPANDALGVCIAGQVHDRRYRMRILHQLFALVAAADGGEWVWGTGSRVCGAAEGPGLTR